MQNEISQFQRPGLIIGPEKYPANPSRKNNEQSNKIHELAIHKKMAAQNAGTLPSLALKSNKVSQHFDASKNRKVKLGLVAQIVTAATAICFAYNYFYSLGSSEESGIPGHASKQHLFDPLFVNVREEGINASALDALGGYLRQSIYTGVALAAIALVVKAIKTPSRPEQRQVITFKTKDIMPPNLEKEEVSKSPLGGSKLEKTQQFLANFIFPAEENPRIIQTKDSKKVRPYLIDLSNAEKSNIQTTFVGDHTFKIVFQQLSTLAVTIRRQDIFESGAQVIVNAANAVLGGGGGIDGAIHNQGEKDYVNAHRALQKRYNANFVLGHAAMIESGALKAKYNINNVIVVAGPQGTSAPEKESQLYSCYYNSLVLAQNQSITSIAFPSISTDIFDFPRDRAASISLKAIHDFIRDNPKTILENISIHFLPKEPKSRLEDYQKAVRYEPKIDLSQPGFSRETVQNATSGNFLLT